VPRAVALISGKGRRFQVDLEPKGILTGKELIDEFAAGHYTSQPETLAKPVDAMVSIASNPKESTFF